MAARQQPSPQTTQGVTIPAPMGGMVSNRPVAEMPLTETLYTVNMNSEAFGLRVRKGYKEWCNPVNDGIFTGIRTIVPGNASGRLNVGDKLFCTTQDGVYDISSGGAVDPVKVVDFADKGEDAGWCSWHNFTNTAGAQFIMLCDLINGYYIYDFAIDTWSKVQEGTNPGTINGVDPDLFCFVTVWKNRVWFVERNSTRAWYLETVGILTGKAIAFDFGSKMRYGGFLKGIYSWTLDAGYGIDDHLVAISSEGDILVYTGTDPTTAGQFGLKGVWYVGETPRGRRIANESGGDILIGTQFGIIPISRLVNGMQPGDEENYITAKINALFRQRYAERRNLFGYEMKIHPSEGGMLIVLPKLENTPYTQLFLDLTTQSWSVWLDVPIITTEHYRGETYFGDVENRIYYLAPGPDNVLVADPNAAREVRFGILTAFSDFGSPVRQKRVQFIRPIFIADSVPSYEVEAKYDYDIRPPTEEGFSGNAALPTGIWDDTYWNQSLWAGSYQIDQPVYGATGIGRMVAISLNGTSLATDTTLAGFELMLDAGGLL